MLPDYFVPDFQNTEENQHWVHWAALTRVQNMSGCLIRGSTYRDENEDWTINMEAFRLGTGLEAVSDQIIILMLYVHTFCRHTYLV